MDGCSQPMMTVYEINPRVVGSDAPDKGTGEFSVVFNEGCACPKPLHTVMNICRWCFKTFGSVVNNPKRSLNGHRRKKIGVERSAAKLPPGRFPKTNSIIGKETLPLFLERLVNADSLPPMTFNRGDNPDLKHF